MTSNESEDMKRSWESEQEKRSKRIDERNARLDAAVPTRICPVCKAGPTLESRRWVVYGTSREPKAMCRSCWLQDRSQVSAAKAATTPLASALIMGVQRTFVVSASALRNARSRAGLSQQDMAEECNWSRAKQRSIEEQDSVLSEGEVRELVALLLSNGVRVWDIDLERVGIAGAGPSPNAR